ncbi:Type II secretion system protein D precursor [Planctomycetes bacterium Poly30]|uniref:Type II secretion system protein D n=1 Tax=Saltatorellus ferox TaxID=2528018 RepID=A0A518EVW5_9BACT|nr:Type II secretion system protein D precursor [Planctomycetes bacterium Poly30]
MRTRLTLLPFLITASVACQAADPQNAGPHNTGQHAANDTIASAVTPITPSASRSGNELFTAPLEAASASGAGMALAANVTASAPQGAQDDFNLAQIRMQKSRALSTQFAELAEEALNRGDIKDAVEQFASAIELDPSNQTAREGFRRALAMQGDPLSTAGEQFSSNVGGLEVREAMARMRAEDFANSGRVAMEQGDYDAAVQNFRQAETILKLNPLIATNSLDEQIIRGELEAAINLRTEAQSMKLQREREEAEEQVSRLQAEEANRLENKLREYYQRADRAFRAEKYAESAKFAELILIRDPGNRFATEMLEIARESGHAKVSSRLRREYRESWLRTFDELRTMDIPQTDALVFDIDRWKDVVDRSPLSELQLEAAANPERDAVMAKLEQILVPARFDNDGEGVPLANVADFLQQQSGINFQLSSAVKDLDEEETAVKLQRPEGSVMLVLNLIAETVPDVSWKIEDGVVLFVTQEELTGGQVNATYSVADLVTPIPDYAAPDINVEPSQGLALPEEDIEEREANVIGISQLEELIRNNVATATWENDPANSIRVTERGQMVVNQTPDVQRQIVALLEDLRESTGILVDIQARFMRVEDNFLEDIGVDFRGLGQPGLGVDNQEFNDFGDGSSDLGNEIGRTSDIGAFFDDGADGNYKARVEDLYDTQLGSDNFQASGGLSFQWAFLNDLQLELILRAVQKSERIETVTAPRVTVNNGARANVSVLNQVAYVQDFDVQIAQAASIADPIIKVIQDGVILDVRPVVSADLQYITLELRPTIAQLQRPIREQPTTLGTQNSVTIQLPEVEIQRVRTSIPIPDGGTVLLGGLKESTKQDTRSGVPILNKIPLISALFERKGNYISNRKLLILLNAQIEIPYEQAPSDAELGRDL